MFLQQTSEAWGQDDQSWLGSAHATDAAQSVTLDTSAFTKATHYPKGYFPSGLPIKRANDGKYVPAAAGDTAYGFLFCAVKAPTDNSIDVVAAMLDHGRVIVSRLPIPVSGAALTNPHFVFVA